MFFPMLDKGNEKKSVISAFSGINFLEKTDVGELCDMSCMTSDCFPALTPSAKLNAVNIGAEIKNIQAVISVENDESEEFKFTGVADGKFYFNGEEKPFAYSFMHIPEEAQIKLLKFSDSIIILPVFYVYEYKNNKKNSKVYPLTPGAYDEYLDVYTGGSQGSSIKISLNGSVTTWTEMGFLPGDSIVLKTGAEDYSSLNVYEPENKYDISENIYKVSNAVVESVTDSELRVKMYNYKGNVVNLYDSKGNIIDRTFKGNLRVYKKYPKFNDACVYANRLWAVTENGESIHASVAGNPGEFMRFEGLSSDSWYTEVGETGTFTGISAFRDGVIAFKKNNIFHIYGDRATNFNIAKKFSNCGCVDLFSVCETDSAVYFLGSDGVYEYSGANPFNVSRKLNLKNCTGGKAFCDGKKYYLCLSGENRIFVYDRQFGVWHIDANIKPVGALKFKNNICFATNDSVFAYDENSENEWYAVLCDITENQISQKGINDIFIRVENSENSYVEIFVRTNDEDFVFCDKTDTVGEYTFRVPVRFKKGDKYSIKISGKGKAVIKDIERSFYIGGKAFSQKGRENV